MAHDVHHIVTWYASGVRVLRSHYWTALATPGPIASILPHKLLHMPTASVALVGPFTRKEEIKARSFHAVRPVKVRDLFLDLVVCNPLYANVTFVDVLLEEELQGC